MNENSLNEIDQLHEQGLTYQEIGKKLEISRQAVWLRSSKGLAYKKSDKYKAYKKAYWKTDKYKAHKKVYQRVYYHKVMAIYRKYKNEK